MDNKIKVFRNKLRILQHNSLWKFLICILIQRVRKFILQLYSAFPLPKHIHHVAPPHVNSYYINAVRLGYSGYTIRYRSSYIRLY